MFLEQQISYLFIAWHWRLE